MSRHPAKFTRGALASVACLAGSLNFSGIAQSATPNFAPSPDIGWYAYNRIFIPPRRAAPVPSSRTPHILTFRTMSSG